MIIQQVLLFLNGIFITICIIKLKKQRTFRTQSVVHHQQKSKYAGANVSKSVLCM